MATTTPRAEESADKLVKDLSNALKRQGIATDILEPSTKIKVFAPDSNAYLDETITLRPNAEEVLTWYWSWGTPICPAKAIGRAVEQIEHVVSATLA